MHEGRWMEMREDGLTMNQRIQRINILLILSSALLYPACLARADGGLLRLRQKAGGYEIAVFTSPTPIRAGTVDVSVLVQEAATGEFVPDAEVTVCIEMSAIKAMLSYAATNDAATNRLFKAAVFKLPRAGSWDVEVAVKGPHGPARVAFAVSVDEQLPYWREVWPWFAWPAIVIAIFGAHQALARRVSRRSAIRNAAAPGAQPIDEIHFVFEFAGEIEC